MERVIISGIPCLMGENISFEQVDIFGLQVGERVTRIGKFTSGCYTESNWKPWIEYSGKIKIDMDYAAFRIPPGGVTGFNLFRPVQSVFVLFAILDFEEEKLLLLQDYKTLNADAMKPIFKRYSV